MYRGKPVAGLGVAADGWHGVGGHGHLDTVAQAQHADVLAIDAECRSVPRGQRHADGHHGGVRQHRRPEGERVRGDGRQEDGGHRRMDHAAASRQRVGSAAGGRGQDEAVALHQRHALAVHAHVQLRQGAGLAPVHQDLVEALHPEALLAALLRGLQGAVPGARAPPPDHHAQAHAAREWQRPPGSVEVKQPRERADPAV
mmetsp:Transcript_23587/g.67437  ORF Transcript_23587/g.67437 Transcript_23587/m.67437 type:complete len:200 (-) Transcript_23587:860-1459(-)